MKRLFELIGVAMLVVALLLPGKVHAQGPIVRAVLFYSPTCPHCHYVMTEVLPPLIEKYGAQLEIAAIDVTNASGQALYQSAVAKYGITEDRLGVPALVVGTTVMVGSEEIPDQFPGLITAALAKGGENWPEIPGLPTALEPIAAPTFGPAAAPAAAAADQPADPPAVQVDTQPAAALIAPDTAAALAAGQADQSLADKLSRDPAGNTVAILFLVAMVGVFVFAIVRVVRALARGAGGFTPSRPQGWLSWALAALALIGLGVSIYMAFVETAHASAICGPIGDCNTVQQSEYAALFGWLPIGVLGTIGYAAILVAWGLMYWGKDHLQRLAASALLVMALFGAAFSIYLTFLEPFIIGATCVWCLTSALCMTLILVILVVSMPRRARLTRRMA
ncbi:MAG: vitamin K epoxide reductase family protein [Caldilineaceae bacterium]